MAQGRGDGLAPKTCQPLTKAPERTWAAKAMIRWACGSRQHDEEGVEVESRTPGSPRSPIGCAYSAGHHRIGNFIPQRVEITRELISDVEVTTGLKGIFTNSERGKTELNEVRNCLSE